MYLAFKGFRSERDIRLSVGSLSRASLAALSSASFPQIHVQRPTLMPLLSDLHRVYATYFGFVSADDQFLVFLALTKWIMDLRKA